MFKKLLVFNNLFRSLIPNQAPEDDTLFNRRRLAYFGLAFSIYWVHLILAVYVFGPPPDAVAITAFLGVPATLAGLGFYKYLKAAENDDAIKIGNNRNSVNINSPDTVIVASEQPEQQDIGTKDGTGQGSISLGNGTEVKRKPD